MERPTAFDLTLAISDYVRHLSSRGPLSRSDQDEIVDHFHMECDTLLASGLTAEEAFLISQKRFGGIDLISAEYHKARPLRRFTELFVTGILSFLGIKLALNLVSILSIGVGGMVLRYGWLDAAMYLTWGDLVLQGGSLIAILIIGLILGKRALENSGMLLWLVPLGYLATEVGQWAITGFATSSWLSLDHLGALKMNSSFLVLGVTVVGALLTSWWLFEMQRRKLRVA